MTQILEGMVTLITGFGRGSIPLRRTGAPEHAPGAIYPWCAPESEYIGGQNLLCSGGVTGAR